MKRALSALAAAALALIGPALAEDGRLPERALGRADAPITIVEYASFTCPHCARFHGVHLPAIKERYIDTGKARLVFRDFPLDGLALKASALARCLPEERYFAFVDEAFRAQPEWADAPRVKALAAIEAIALRHGGDKQALAACADDEALLDDILRMRQEGERRHAIDSTPSFIVEGRTYSGDMTVADFARILEPLLAPR